VNCCWLKGPAVECFGRTISFGKVPLLALSWRRGRVDTLNGWKDRWLVAGDRAMQRAARLHAKRDLRIP